MQKTTSVHHYSSSSLRIVVNNNYTEPTHSTVSINIVSSKMETQTPNAVTFCEDLSLELADAIKEIKTLQKLLPKKAEEIPFEMLDDPDEVKVVGKLSNIGSNDYPHKDGRYVCLSVNENTITTIKNISHPDYGVFRDMLHKENILLSSSDIKRILRNYVSNARNKTHSRAVLLIWTAPSDMHAKWFIKALFNTFSITAFVRKTKPQY